MWQDEKDFTLDIPMNIQNSRVYGMNKKENIPANPLLTAFFIERIDKQKKLWYLPVSLGKEQPSLFCQRKWFKDKWKDVQKTSREKASS